MTIQQPIRKFAGPALCAALFSALAACSGSKADDEAGTAGSAGQASTAGSSGKDSGAAGSSGSGTSGSGNAGSSGSNEIVGTFQVQMLVDKGMTKIVGQVSDAPVPANIIWTVAKKDGACWVEKPTTPFCEEGCGADVCIGDNKCQPYPGNHSVGEVKLTGVHVEGGGTELTLKEIAKTYQPSAATTLAYPTVSPKDTIEVHAAGGDYAAFDLSAPGVDPIEFTSKDFDLDPTKPFEITWDAAADTKAAKIHLKIDLSHHGGVKGLIECDSEDTGSLTISAALISELIGLGVAGFPSVVLTRTSLDTAPIAPGLVRLEVSALTERFVTTPGVTSCTEDDDCESGKTCRSSDSTCQ